MFQKNIPTVVIPALSPYSLNHTKISVTKGTSGLEEHGSSSPENDESTDFMAFSLLVL